MPRLEPRADIAASDPYPFDEMVDGAVPVYVKKLSRNDRLWSLSKEQRDENGFNNSHQGGPYVHLEACGSIFPLLDDAKPERGTAVKKRMIEINIYWPDLGRHSDPTWLPRVTNYISKKKETHLTRLPKEAFNDIGRIPLEQMAIVLAKTGDATFLGYTVDTESERYIAFLERYGIATEMEGAGFYWGTSKRPAEQGDVPQNPIVHDKPAVNIVALGIPHMSKARGALPVVANGERATRRQATRTRAKDVKWRRIDIDAPLKDRPSYITTPSPVKVASATDKHEETVRFLAQYAKGFGHICETSSKDGRSDAVIRADAQFFIFEIKSNHERNTIKQVDTGVGQLLRYYDAVVSEADGRKVSKWLLLSQRPDDGLNLSYLERDHIRLLWVEDGKMAGPDAPRLRMELT